MRVRLQKAIEQLGYRPNEVKVYLAALSLGECTTTELAHQAQIPRTSVQTLADSLHRAGLLNVYLRRRHKYWVAENPNRLLTHLQERAAALGTILPELRALSHPTITSPSVKLYTGPEELKQILEDIIETKHHMNAILSWYDWVQIFGAAYVQDFIERRARHFLKIRLITPKTDSALLLKEKDAEELRHTKFLPEGVKINNTNFFYGNKIALISLNRKQPQGVVIEDPDIAYTQNVLFESLWTRCADH